MATILPNLSDAANIKYGIPDLYAAHPEWFAETTNANRYPIAINDRGINRSSGLYRTWVNEGEIPGNEINDDGNGVPGNSVLDYIDDINGWSVPWTTGDLSTDVDNVHAQKVVEACAKPTPEAAAFADVRISSSPGVSPSHFNGLMGLAYAQYTPQIKAINFSYALSSAIGVADPLADLDASDTILLAPSAGKLEELQDEALYPLAMTTAAVNIANDAQTDNKPGTTAAKTYFGAYATAVSWASPMPGSVLALLYRVDLILNGSPTLTQAELRQLVIDGCTKNATTDAYCKYGIINHKASVEAFVGSLSAKQFFFQGSEEQKTEADTPKSEPEAETTSTKSTDDESGNVLKDGEIMTLEIDSLITIKVPAKSEIVGDGITQITKIKEI